jgi:hypothetical protein
VTTTILKVASVKRPPGVKTICSWFTKGKFKSIIKFENKYQK